MITHIVGNRPQFIKLAPLFHELEKRGYNQEIVHTGQHYDANLSEVFFRELRIPQPNINLAIGSGSHANMIAKAMVGVEEYLLKTNPQVVILYGDTDSTVAAALATCKLDIPIAHIEGGARTGNKRNPEENNRVVVDHISDIIFCPDRDSLRHATDEGLTDISYCTGDIMYDTYLETCQTVERQNVAEDIVLMTWHRQENTCSKERMQAILNLVSRIDCKVVCPLHPRTVECLKKYNLYEQALGIKNFDIIEPVGYYKMVELMSRSKIILTDSGGLSKESSFAGVHCLFMLDLDVWPELRENGWIKHINPEDILSINEAIATIHSATKVSIDDRPKLFGSGNTASIIADLMRDQGYI